VVEIPNVTPFDSKGQLKRNQRFPFNDSDDFPQEWLNMVHIATSEAYPPVNIDIPVIIPSRTPWFEWLRGLRLRKGA
jgi:hypothetical protein